LFLVHTENPAIPARLKCNILLLTPQQHRSIINIQIADARLGSVSITTLTRAPPERAQIDAFVFLLAISSTVMANEAVASFDSVKE
jgi:hypothetical protein